MNSNDIGCYSEYRIASALMSQGYKISMPLNDSSVYDMIVDSGSKLYKIQIKGTTRKPQGNRRGVQVNITRNRKYSKTEIDFYAIWVEYYKGYFFLKNENQKQHIRFSNRNSAVWDSAIFYECGKSAITSIGKNQKHHSRFIFPI